MQTAKTNLDYTSLELLRQTHPAWRLLCSPHAALVASFLNRIFIVPNVRTMAQSNLVESLEDELFALREYLGAEAFPKLARDYLNDWAQPERGWLRKFYRQDSDEPYFDLTPATEKAISWLESLSARSFVGTESRLLTLFELLKQMSQGSETDPQLRIAELRKRRDEIDTEIARVLSGDIPLLNATALKDRFQQFTQLARDLLTDFREVEQNFRVLDRRVRERIAQWDSGKGSLLEQIMGERDAITDSDQGLSFRAFWDFLMSSQRQEELSTLLERVLALPPVAALHPDARLYRVHYDWLEAGEHTQRTVANLSKQLRRFLDDQAWLENRRIMDILHDIEKKALALRDSAPETEIMYIADTSASINLPLERPLHTPTAKPRIENIALTAGDSEVDTNALFSQVVIDKSQLIHHIQHILQDRVQVTLRETCELRPLQHGLAELVTYLQLGDVGFKTMIDETITDTIIWQSSDKTGQAWAKQAQLPRVIFVR
ncbi:DUF3375 domain-containing protein [Candidatus Venteria ishoeyi]|uniref:DUF3375 domain-containing protein n=1 Tax=Candidatus Venteria ishoeyi TaxID=1899563 RepID=UPI0025A52E3B|nr:DUF3375 domain-containing protein [Candidatus Venteria ishoeyi]MDM8547061.1 DUF3375 domain-containing protein [Candidatus Venteria ishoeyi]